MTKTGALSGLRLDEDELPGPGEVRVKVRAVGLNFADVFSVLGLYQAAPPTPFVPGLELCGVVESVGPARDDLPTGTVVPSYAPGDACMAVVRFGAYATAVNAPAHQTRPLPREWSHAQGAGFLVQGLTAFYALRGTRRRAPRPEGPGALRRGRVRDVRRGDMPRGRRGAYPGGRERA